MISYKMFAGYICLLLMLFACKKEKSAEEGEWLDDNSAAWAFKEKGTGYQGSMDSAITQVVEGISLLTLRGESEGGEGGEILLQLITDDLRVGDYTTPFVFFQYAVGDRVLFQHTPADEGNFLITLTQIDSATISGTFSGSALSETGTTEIMEGTFKAFRVKETGTEPPPMGMLTVWTRNMCLFSSQVDISVDDQTNYLTESLSAMPSCGVSEPGVANFLLPEGIYTLTASCGGNNITYQVEIVAGACTVQELDFGVPPLSDDYLPLLQGMLWEYRDLNNPATVQTITVTDEVDLDGRNIIDGKQYQECISSLGDTFYFRKSGASYYQYRQFDFQDGNPDAPAIEFEILREDSPEGETWTSAIVDIGSSGINVKAQLRSTIVRKDFSAQYHGVTFQNLIEVKSELMVSFNGGASFSPTGEEFTTVFARGIGIVYYDDYIRDIDWGLSGGVIHP